MKADKEKNDLLKSIYDEMEFNDIKKSIQFHKNQTNEEIESTLLKEKNNNNNKNNDKDNDNDFIKHSLLNKKKLEVKDLEENIKYMKYFSRKNYEDIRDKNINKLMYVMIGIMIIIFMLYLIGNKYKRTINKILSTLLMQEE